MKIKLNTIKSILKFIIIIVLLGLAAYFLYKIVSDNLIEGFDPTDCSDCKMNPSRGDCIEITDFSFETVEDAATRATIPQNFTLDASFLFCPWEPNCYNVDSNLCCSGSDFYNNNTNIYQNFFITQDISKNCNELNTILNDLSNSSGGKQSNQYKQAINNMSEIKPLGICSNYLSNIIENKKGMLFKREYAGESIVFLDDYNTPQQILDYMAINSFNRDNDIDRFDVIIVDLSNLTATNVNDLTEAEIALIQSHKQELYSDFSLSSAIDICYQYQVYNTSGQIPTDSITNRYLLNENEFYSCSGEIVDQEQLNDMTFTQSQLDDFSDNNYFGDSSLNTFESDDVRFYNTENDLKMQLKNLPDLNQSSMAPVSIINQYMTSINSFYEKQMANMMGPKTHSVNDTLQFDNGTLESKQSTFFSYNSEPNNEYECDNSITGNPIFNYCGPKPYQDDNPIQ